MFSGTAQVSHQVRHFFFSVSSVCLLVRVTMVDKNKAVVCCLLATSAIMLSEKKKRKLKNVQQEVVFGKEYIMRCSSAELLETVVPRDNVIVASAGKLSKTVRFPE